MGTLMQQAATLPSRLRRVTSSGSYVPQIDGLRFIAILIVIFYHSASRAVKYYHPQGDIEKTIVLYLPNGIAGVELFFFISGMIISYPFLTGNGPTLGKFYKRRLLRLEPPYMLVLTICFLGLGVFGLKPEHATQFDAQNMPLWQSYISSIFYMHGTLYGTAPLLNPPLWSLEIEVAFYLLSPFLLAFYAKLLNPKARLVVGIAVVGIALLVQSICTSIDYTLHYKFPFRLYAFFLGILASDWTARTPNFYASRTRCYDWVFIFGFILLFVSASFQNVATEASSYTVVLLSRAVAIFCLFVGSAWGPVARRIMGAPWIALIGGACYSIYLVHIPVMNVVASLLYRVVHPDNLPLALLSAFTVLLFVSVVAGMIFYVLIERPCMKQDWPQSLWRACFSKVRISPASDSGDAKI
jgi:peptidoglycan/LPS O-acetylase OafA/YrhL